MPTKLSQQPKPLSPDKKQVITVSVANGLVKRLDVMARRAARSRSALVEMAVREYTDAHTRGRRAVA